MSEQNPTYSDLVPSETKARKTREQMIHARQCVCDECGRDGKYNELYDSYYCDFCGKWLEEGCEDPKCSFCTPRPEHPVGL